MSHRTSVFAFALACLFAQVAPAQAQAPAPDPVGVWRGTSLCRVRPSACKDENVVYRITRVNASDTLVLDARKIVNGQEEEMGVLACLPGASVGGIRCAMPNGVWSFSIRGDSLVGELRLPDNRKFRDVRAVRSH